MKKVGRNALLSIYFHIFVIYSINKTKVDNSEKDYQRYHHILPKTVKESEEPYFLL